MFSILIHCSPASEDEFSAALWEAGTCGIVEEPGGLRAFFEDSVNLECLVRQIGRTPDSLRDEPNLDWARISRDSFQPICIGQRFFMSPPWCDDPPPDGRFRLAINPGMACGTGYHQCTQMCLEAMERYLQPGGSLLDVGTGSGILSLAGKLLGAGFVLSCDLDDEAVVIARDLITNPLFVGSADAVGSNSFDLIVANISAAAVENLAPEFERIKRPGGRLILSGFTASDSLEGFTHLEVLRKDDWLCFVI